MLSSYLLGDLGSKDVLGGGGHRVAVYSETAGSCSDILRKAFEELVAILMVLGDKHRRVSRVFSQEASYDGVSQTCLTSGSLPFEDYHVALGHRSSKINSHMARVKLGTYQVAVVGSTRHGGT